MVRNTNRGIACVLLFVSMPISPVYAGIPTLSEIQLRIDHYRSIENKGNIGSLLSGFDEAPQWLEWTMLHKETELLLVAGKQASFFDRLRKLEEMNLPKDSSSAIHLAELYSLAVEAGYSSIDPQRFSDALDRVRERIGTAIPTHGGAKRSYDDAKRRRLRANFFYLTGNTTELKKLYQVEGPSDEGAADDTLVKGYILLLIAQQEQTDEAANLVIEQLQSLDDEQAEQTGQEIGLLALYIGSAHLILASNAKYSEKPAQLAQAEKYAKKARQNLEIIDVPVMWNRAMSLIADVLSMQRDLAEVGSATQKKLQIRSNRAHELSIQIH